MVSDFETRSYKPQQILEYPSLLSVSTASLDLRESSCFVERLTCPGTDVSRLQTCEEAS